MMDYKKSLSEDGGDLEKVYEYLQKKGLSTADKKSRQLVAEGRIGSYIHDFCIIVLIEDNCETVFGGRGETFKELVDDLAKQVAFCPQGDGSLQHRRSIAWTIIGAPVSLCSAFVVTGRATVHRNTDGTSPGPSHNFQ
ncbi:Elongation factor Ts [Capsicum chinense]|nr:Elongation factor Ts [Capsicum chinense]